MACKPKIFTIWLLRKKFSDHYREIKKKGKELKIKSFFMICCDLLLLSEKELSNRKAANTDLY